MPRILLLTTDLAWGGAERVVLEEALALRAAGDVVWIAGLRHPDGELARRARAADLEVLHLPGASARTQLRELVARARIELVHAHLFHAAELARRAALPVPWIVEVHNSASRALPWRRLGERRQAREARFALAVSRAVAIDWQRRAACAPERVRLLPNALAAPARALAPPRADGPLRLGFLGRLVREKGADLWARAFPDGLPPDTALAIAGAGRLAPALARWATRRGARVELHGLVRDLDAWFEGIDALVVPSRSEGFGLAAGEALVRGRALLAADLPALRELAGSAAPHGTFFAPRASALAVAIEELRAERAARIAWARQRGAELLRDHDPEVRARALRELHAAALREAAELARR
ncbi:MAG: glycosyltransferase [Planctomycetes bacterium]|nr:glycosyltransferase [Planctomycetota bacterium]